MLKIIIITQNEPFFIPKLLQHLIQHQESDYCIKGITVLNPHRRNKNYLHWFNERIRIYTLFELLISSFAFLYCKLKNKFNLKSAYSLKSLIKRFELKELKSDDINNLAYFQPIKEMQIDIILSISCPQLFKQDLLDSAKYCINAHGTLLPSHRGVFGSWWTLFVGDRVGGSTIHTMELKLDAGQILWQKEFPVEVSDTQYSIAYKTKRDMSFGIIEVLKKISNGNFSTIEPRNESSYHQAPTREQGKEFHKKGYRIITLKDLKLILSKSF